jgi:stalled ribosome alternative rescue factor ArfA
MTKVRKLKKRDFVAKDLLTSGLYLSKIEVNRKKKSKTRKLKHKGVSE